MKKFKTLLATATSTLVYANSVEQQFQQGFETAQKGDYQTAFELWKPLAEQGDAAAQFSLGVMYYKGEGVRQNKAKAKDYFGLACDNGEQRGCDNYCKLNRGRE